MRKDGRGHGDDDVEPWPVISTVLAIVTIVMLGWLLAGRPTFGLF